MINISGWITPDNLVVFCSAADYFVTIREAPEFREQFDIIEEIELFDEIRPEFTSDCTSKIEYSNFKAQEALSYNKICRRLYDLGFIRFIQDDLCLVFNGSSCDLTRRLKRCHDLASENKLTTKFKAVP